MQWARIIHDKLMVAQLTENMLVFYEYLTLANDELDAKSLYLIIQSIQSSTCFEQRRAHHQKAKLLIQHLVWSLSVSGRPVHRCTFAPDGHLQRVTIPDSVLINLTS